MTPTIHQKILAWTLPVAIEGAALVRAVLLARALGADEMGRAMMLALVLRLAEMMSDIGLERLMVQAPDGDTPELQSSLHGAAWLRGLLLACGLLALAPALAASLPDGPSIAAYASLALIPAFKGVQHLDHRRAERLCDYRKTALVEGSGAVAMLATATFCLAVPDASHTAIVMALLAHAATATLMSHLVAQRGYRVTFEIPGLYRAWTFGAPLALNAGLMFLTLQADRLFVIGAWGWVALAVYGTAAQLAYLPAQIVGRAANALLLPRLRQDRSDLLVQAQRHAICLGAAFGLGFGLGAVPFISWVFGPELAPSTSLAAALGLAAGLRIARTPLSICAVAQGRTGDPAKANVWRAAALLPAFGMAAMGAPLAALALAAALGEAAAAVRAWTLLSAQPKECST